MAYGDMSPEGGGMSPPAAGGGPPAVSPNSPAGPPGAAPGIPSATSPGPGAGRQAAASAAIKQVMGVMHKTLGMFPPESEQFKALADCVKILVKSFGGSGDDQGLKAIASMMMSRGGAGGGRTGAPVPGPAGGAGMGAPPAGGMPPGMGAGMGALGG
jgi:hypothetical protein